MDSALTFDTGRLVLLDRGTYRWVSLKRFRIDSARPVSELLSALVAHPSYRDHFASAFETQGIHTLHGPYRVECITADTFRSINSSSARTLLQDWAGNAGVPVSREVQAELDTQVFPLLEAPELFQLPDLRPDAQHDWGWVVGVDGFHELVAIDQADRVLTLIVAADD
ncbi:hypothetical protein [Nocardia sp. NBC_01327]|uniref:hypothetical protein n=1 Tax=Nocardia sp. NBC_01327 TaxID=2903593 RepID=UPI002E15A0C2|nr:hypothetical protein OG326_34545 [Nocardia sp. NBC_01327]